MPVDLPFELERDIFERCALVSPAAAVQLVLVAHRVRVWIDPILYGTVALKSRATALQFLSTTEAKPELASHVNKLCIHPTIGYLQARRVLSICPNLDDLACWICEPRLRPLLSPQRPERLSLMLSGLSYDTEDNAHDFSSPFFGGVTHLHLMDHWAKWVTWHGFELLPKITHLALVYDDSAIADDRRVAQALGLILDACPQLRVCLLLQAVAPVSSLLRDIQDSRFVVLQSHTGGTGCSLNGNVDMDMWGSAEMEVRMREH